MTTEKITSRTLKLSIIVGFMLILAGEMLDLTGHDNTLLEFGILFLILSPLFAVASATLSLAVNREWKWVIASIIMILITIVGVLIAMM